MNGTETNRTEQAAPRAQLGTLAGIALQLTLLVLLTVFTFNDLDHPFGNGDEVRHAKTLAEMMETGDVWTMRWQGVPSFTRPATQYWLAAIGASFIEGEAGMRASSAACSLLIVALCWWLAWRSFGRMDLAALAALLCAGAPTFHDYSRSLMSEPPLVLALMAALAGTLLAQRSPRGLTIALACLGGAVAVKSFGAAPPAVLLVPWLWLAWRKHRDTRSVLIGGLIGLCLALPFYVIGYALHGNDFLAEHFGFNLLDRAGGRLGISAYPWYFYLDHIPARDGVPTAAWITVGTIGAALLALVHRDRTLGIIATLGLGDLIVMSMVGTRLPHYILVLYPAAALGAVGVLHAALLRATPRVSAVLGAVLPFAAIALLLFNLPMEGGRGFLLQTPAAKELGLAAGREAAPGQRVYAYEWYGQGLNLYAKRDVVLLTAVPARHAIINVAHFRRFGAAVLVPPAPEPVGSRILVAGYKRDLDAASWMQVERAVALSDRVFLVWARIVE